MKIGVDNLEGEPSPEDKSVTGRWSMISNKLGVELLDHYVVGKEGVYSFALHEDESINLNEEYYTSLNKKTKEKELYGKQLSLSAFEL